MDMNALIDLAKERADIDTDYALAKALAWKPWMISHMRKGRRHPSTTEAAQLAALAKIDEMKVIAEVELQTANTEQKKEFWQHFIEARGYAATLGTIGLGLALLASPDTCRANESLHKNNYAKTDNFALQNNGIYIMRKI